jgi:outer membrane protein OmpA-like peptidoglycan-associated protein
MRELGIGFALAAVLLGGCPPEKYEGMADATLVEVNQILDDTSLRPYEQRDALTALGFSPETINGLLADTRLANQFGGNLRTAYDKVIGEQLDTLTPDEIQIWGLTASDVGEDLDYDLSDAEAQAMADFLADNGLNSPAKLAAYLDDESNYVPAAIPPDALQDLFVDFDPDLVIPEFP